MTFDAVGTRGRRQAGAGLQGKGVRIGAIGAALALLFAMPGASAQAAIMMVTVEGIVQSSTNTTGEFGGGNLNGRSFVAQMRYDTSLGYDFPLPFDDATSQLIVAGEGYPGVSFPILEANLTINGVTKAFAPNYAHQLRVHDRFYYNQSNPGTFTYEAGWKQTTGGVFQQYDIDLYGLMFTPNALDVAYTATYIPGTNMTFGNFGFGTSTVVGNQRSYSELVYGSLFAERVTVVDTATLSAVPEPGAWALTIAGFGGVGAVLRRRRTYLAEA